MRFAFSTLRFVSAAFAAAALLLSVLAVAPTSSARQGAGGVKKDSGAVVIPLGVVDKEGRPVEGLKAEDLRVAVEGAEQKILSISPRTEEPLHVVVMLDASASQEQVLKFARPAAIDLVKTLLRPGKDDAAVVSFTGDTTLEQGLTADFSALGRAIESVEFVPPRGYVGGGVIVGNPTAASTGSTALWDALWVACEEVLAPAKRGRKAIVLFTDGVDTSSRMNLDKAVERLIRDGVSVYSVGIGDTLNYEGVEKEGLGKVSKRTGGRAFFPKRVKDLVQSLEQIRGEVVSAYALALAPAAPKGAGKLNKLRVEVVNPELRKRGVELAYPQGFFQEFADAIPGRR